MELTRNYTEDEVQELCRRAFLEGTKGTTVNLIAFDAWWSMNKDSAGTMLTIEKPLSFGKTEALKRINVLSRGHGRTIALAQLLEEMGDDRSIVIIDNIKDYERLLYNKGVSNDAFPITNNRIIEDLPDINPIDLFEPEHPDKHAFGTRQKKSRGHNNRKKKRRK